MIYLDNAATTFPKPDAVWEAVLTCGKERCGNPGRSGHALAAAAARELFSVREAVAGFFNIADSSRLVFTLNATAALNTALYGLLREGDHVVTSSLEHNSVMRPLHALERKGVITLTMVPCGRGGELDPDDVQKALRPATRLVVLTHASNVCGAILPIREIKALLPEIPLLVDAAQSAGVLPIDVQALGIDLLAFSGHKGLFGPMGTGGLYTAPGLKLSSLVQGGTGSRSEQLEHPDFLPDLLEAGTPNLPGLSGLRAGVEFLAQQGIATIRDHEMRLTGLLLEGLAGHDKIRLHGPADPQAQTAVVSVTIDGRDPGAVARSLDREYGIACRASLHCAPVAHRTLGTFPQGTVRLSMSFFNTEAEIKETVRALGDIAEGKI
ncbi:MAG: aminotransferase class V-fold PLP-dependent enzyme [Desulfuromonadaceae bacterium]|nr:aminotransferase class V-fold PLP-dependent enzyme [Desulfuromonadaceae bacterium]